MLQNLHLHYLVVLLRGVTAMFLVAKRCQKSHTAFALEVTYSSRPGNYN